LRVELELSGLDLREVEHLIDEAKKVSPQRDSRAAWDAPNKSWGQRHAG